MKISFYRLFLIFLRVGAFTFGGGYAMIPIFERELVHRYKLIKPEEFYDTLTICQSFPGAIAVNFATFIGYKLKGYRGAFVSLLGVILPSFVFILLIAMFLFQFIEYRYVEAFFRGVRLSVVALIVLAGYQLLKHNRSWLGIFIIAFTLALIVALQAHPIIAIAFSGTFGYMVYTVREVIARVDS